MGPIQGPDPNFMAVILSYFCQSEPLKLSELLILKNLNPSLPALYLPSP